MLSVTDIHKCKNNETANDNDFYSIGIKNYSQGNVSLEVTLIKEIQLVKVLYL